MAGLTTEQMMLVEQRVANDAPSTGVAYLLWFFLGVLSGHRWYLGRQGTAMLQILLNLILVGLVWVLIDAFLIPGMIREKKDAIRRRVQQDLLVMGAAGSAAA